MIREQINNLFTGKFYCPFPWNAGGDLCPPHRSMHSGRERKINGLSPFGMQANGSGFTSRGGGEHSAGENNHGLYTTSSSVSSKGPEVAEQALRAAGRLLFQKFAERKKINIQFN